MLSKSQEKRVAVQQQREVATLDEETRALLESGAGQEDLVGRDVVAIPFITILQPLSPQVNPAEPDYIEGAKPGQIIQTVTREVSVGVQFIPCVFQRSFVEWVPRDAGGGFRGEHFGEEAIIQFNTKLVPGTGKARLDNGNDLVDTRSYYGLQVLADGTLAAAMISMASTQTKASKSWNAMMKDYRPPGVLPGVQVALYAAVYNLVAVPQENKKGKWYGWRITRLQPTPLEMLRPARTFYEQVKGGGVVVDRSTLAPEEEERNGDVM